MNKLRPSYLVLTMAGLAFLALGLFKVLPAGLGAQAGLLWTGVSAVLVAVGIAGLLGKLDPGLNAREEARLKELQAASLARKLEETRDQPLPAAAEPAHRLERLRELRDRDLITQEEYEAKRAEIVKEL